MVLLEANRIGWGASGRNGGQVCSGFSAGMDAIEGWVGKDDARLLFGIAEEAKGIMSKTTNRYSPEVRERAVRLVLNNVGEHENRWSAIVSILSKIGCASQTLNDWVKKVEVDRGERAGVRTQMVERLKALERENRELKQANEILEKASAYFAQAELDRRSRT